VEPMTERRPVSLLVVLGLLGVVGVLIVGGFFFVMPGSRGSPPVDVLSISLVKQNGMYYDQIAIRNHGSQAVTVRVYIKTAADFDPRHSSPTVICPGCVVTVLILELQPSSNQTPEQYQMMQYGMTHPKYIEVRYA